MPAIYIELASHCSPYGLHENMYPAGLTCRVGGRPDGGKDPICPLWRGLATHDSMILGPQKEVIKFYNRLKDQFSSIGLEMRDDKCQVFSPVGIQNWNLNIPIKQDVLIILGSLVGSLSFIKNTFAKQVNFAKSF